MDGPRLQISDRMRRFLNYPKFAGPTRMLILEADYFFERSWRHAAEGLGWQVHGVPSAMVGGLTREDVEKLFTALGAFRPDFILGSNYAGMDTQGMFARFFEDARIPHVSWFTDTPRMILHGREVQPAHYAVAATWEKAYVPHFDRLGFQHVFHMPLATDPELFSGHPEPDCVRPLAFVGTSMIDQANEAWEKLEHLPEVVRSMLGAFEEGRVTRDKFARGIETILEPDLLAPLDASERRHVELCLVYEATRRQRAEMALRLAPHGMEVRGDPHWATVVANAGGTVGYFDDLAGFYRNTAVNLNTTSLQMKNAVNQRVFDCPAAGGFLITDAQQDIEDLFDPEHEAVTYHSFDELEDKALFYLRHPDQRIPIIQRAQRRVLAHHTHAHRLHALGQYLRERFAS